MSCLSGVATPNLERLASSAVTTRLRPKSVEDCPRCQDTEENREAVWVCLAEHPNPNTNSEAISVCKTRSRSVGRFTGHKVPPLLEPSGTSTWGVTGHPEGIGVSALTSNISKPQGQKGNHKSWGFLCVLGNPNQSAFRAYIGGFEQDLFCWRLMMALIPFTEPRKTGLDKDKSSRVRRTLF